MKLKIYASFLVVALLLACRPPAQAQLTPSHPDTEVSGLQGTEPKDDDSEEDSKKGPRGITEKYYDCMKQALGMIERAECISSEENRQDARLNDSYRKLLGLLKVDRKQYLIEAQREWVVLREKDATFEASLFENTQTENIAGAEREVFYIAERADLIQEWLDMTKAD